MPSITDSRRVNAGNKNTPSMHHPQKQNVTTSMVVLKNDHICNNLSQNGEPQRYSWGTQKKKKKEKEKKKKKEKKEKKKKKTISTLVWRPGKNSTGKAEFDPGSSALEVDALPLGHWGNPRYASRPMFWWSDKSPFRRPLKSTVPVMGYLVSWPKEWD